LGIPSFYAPFVLLVSYAFKIRAEQDFNKPLQKCFLKEKTPHIPWLLVVKLFLSSKALPLAKG